MSGVITPWARFAHALAELDGVLVAVELHVGKVLASVVDDVPTTGLSTARVSWHISNRTGVCYVCMVYSLHGSALPMLWQSWMMCC